MDHQKIIDAIEASPLNRGLRGSDWLAEAGNVAIVTGDDVTLFDAMGDYAFEVHFLFNSRGRAAIDAAKEAFRRLFTEHEANLIIGRVPKFRKDVAMLARWIGGKFSREVWTAHGTCDLYFLSKEMWEGKIK